MGVFTAKDARLASVLHFAIPAALPALALAALMACPMEGFAVALPLLVLSLIIAPALCLLFAGVFASEGVGWPARVIRFVVWIAMSLVAAWALAWVVVHFAPFTEKPGWLYTRPV